MFEVRMAANLTNGSTEVTDDSAWKAVESVAFDIQTYYLWVIFALGFPGNCATIVTVIKMSPARSLTVYIALLAVVDNLAIINKLLLFVLLDNGVHLQDVGCKILGYFGNFLITFANWLLVAMSVERFAAVWFPFKVGQSWTFKKSLIAVVLVALPLSVLFLHLFWMIKFVTEGPGMVYCDVEETYKHFMMHIWYWINVIVYAVIPCTLLLVFNCLIVGGIIKSGKAQKYLNSNYGNQKSNSCADRHRQVTIMLVTAAITLVILTTPRCVILVLTPYWTPEQNSMKGAVKYLIDTLAFVLCDVTHAINFYVYSLSARRFRFQFVQLFMCRRRKMAPVNTQYFSLSPRASLRVQMSFVGEEHGNN
ncbi:probable G-protein coupled receptor 139 [Haliotis cracherodii]|uniref:probable G-protein coupled receptor 139 n=1 Tax=Haliotis cracherodii TaxID=6455 RepID=UPI0039E98A5D